MWYLPEALREIEEDSDDSLVLELIASFEIDTARPDVSCTLALQFFLRDGHLHTTTYMRGNDAVIGLLSDVFSFTVMQEFTALQLGVQLGSYGHHVGSMHINEADAGRAAAIVGTAGHRYAWFPVDR